MSTEKRIPAKLRLGLILNREFHEKNRWVSALTPRLVESLLQRFDCFWIQDQKDYENKLGSVDALLSMEPGWAAPRLDFVRIPALKEKLARTPSYIMFSDPHENPWREDYFLQNGLDFILAYFYSPTLYHFRRAPADRILYFPWSIPDDWVSTEPITCRKQSRIALFGASQHEAYDVRNWCRTFHFVESLTNSGVENKVMSDEEYMKWLGTWDAAIAAGSDDPRYRLTTPKYFEIPAAGSLLFAQETDDLERLGFRHMENCILFNRSNFVELARQYLTSPADYAAIRKAGRELIRRRHRMSARMDFLEHHIRQGLEGNIHRRKTALGGKKKVTAAASRNGAGPQGADRQFEHWFKQICIPDVLDEALREQLTWQGKSLSWEVCHEVLAYQQFTGEKYSAETLIHLSNHRYELLDRLWPGGESNREALDRFYARSADILPWGHGVFLFDHNKEDRRNNFVRRVELLRCLKAAGIESLVDYGAGGGHTSLLAKAMAFRRVIHYEYSIFLPYIAWRAERLRVGDPQGRSSTFMTAPAEQPLSLEEPVQAVICTDVVEHVHDPDAMMEDIYGSLAPGGLLVWVACFDPAISCHLHSHLRGKEESLLARHGFERAGDLPVSYLGHTGIYRKSHSVAKRDAEGTGAASSVSTSSQTQQAAAFLSPEEVYLASADRMDRVVSNLRELKSQQIKQVDTYASVIGGLSGLNYLLAFDPRAIVFFDINPGMVAYARLIKVMIGLSETPEEFISRIFCRSIETYLARTREEKLTCENQRGFLSMPVDETLLSDTLDRLSSEERSTFEAFVAPHLPARTLEGARNCRRLLPCWPIDERVPVGAGEAMGTDEKGTLVPNTNTFFYGQGWLASKEDYRKVRQALQDRPVRFMSFDLLRDDWHLLSSLGERFVLHISNVDDWFPEAWKERAQALDRRVVEAQGLCWVATSHNGISYPAADPHTYAYAALAPYACGEVVEVTHKVPWGFHEIDRVNVTVEDYLRRNYRSDTTILHILVGEGISRDRFEQVLRKALDRSERVIILEHNAASSDWTAEQSKRFIREEHLHETVKRCLHGSSFKLSRTLHLAGERDLRRNLLVILNRDTAEDGKVDRPTGQTDRTTISPRNGSPGRQARPRILLIVDVPNWIFARHGRMLKRHLSDEFDFTIKVQGEPFREEEFDLIYPLEWNLVEPGQIGNPQKYVTGIRSHVWWPDLNFTAFTGFLASTYQRVHVVSRRLYDIFKPALPGAVYISHGIDTEFFTPSARTDRSGKKLRLGWAGNRQQPAKRFKEFIEPLGKIPGVELVFCGYADRNLTMEEMHAFYDSLDAYICASDNEGNNNSLMEAASMKRAIITTDSGTVPEYLIDGKNALIVPREREAFVQAVEKLRDDPALRMKLGKAARRAVISAWDWKDRSEDYRHFFREALRTAQEPALQLIAQPASVKGERAIQGVSQKETPERSYEIIRKVIQAGMVPEAMRALQELIQSHPGFASAHHDLGVLYHNSNEKEKALAHYEKAVSLDPEKPAFLQSLADFYVVEQNRTEDALQIYLRILKNDPSNIEMLSITGNLLAVTGNPDTARGYYLKILEMDPENQNARENLRFLASMEQGKGRLRGGETEHRQGAPSHDFRVVAIISAHNEGDVIYHVIGDLIQQGVSVYLLDHQSTDHTVEEAAKWLGKGLLHIEKFPDDSNYAEENKSQYIWRDILKRKGELASRLDADWFIHADADEFRESPWPGLTLKEAIQVVDRLGYNAIDFELLNFRPVDNSFVPGKDVREYLKHYEGAEDYNSRQVKAWKNLRLPIDLVTSGGHDVAFDGRMVFPVRFILRHYPIRSQQHGLLKVFHQRKNRFSAVERAMAWHVQYDLVRDEKHNFLHNPEQLFSFDGDKIRKRLLAGTLHGESATRETAPLHCESSVSREANQRFGRSRGKSTDGSLDSARKFARTQASEAHESIRRVLIDGSSRAEVIMALGILIETHPDYAPACYELGMIHHENGEKEKALLHYKKAVALEPLNAGFIRHLADFHYVELKQIDEAFCLYEKILAITPEDVETLCVLGNLSVESRAFDRARLYYAEALQIDPANETAGTMLDALESKGLGSTAEENPDIALIEARRLARKGETERAIIKLETLLRLHPEEARAHNDLGNLHCLQKEIEKALFHLDRAVQLQPGVLRFVKDLADAHLAEMGNVEAALKLYNRALALKPDDIDTLLRIGNLCAAQKQFDPARFFYGRVLSIEPGNAQAEENLSVLLRMVEEKPSPAEPAPVCQGTGRLIGEGAEAKGCALSSKATHRCASIIIPVFNQVEFTARCLETLYANTLLDRVHEIIVVDNASSDGTGTFLVEARKRYPKLKVLTNRENLLFAKACNQGADAAGGDYLVFLNNDTEPLAGWLGNAIDRLESDDSIGILGIKLLYPDRTVQHCGIQFQRNAHPSYVVWPLHRYPHASADDPRVNVSQDVHAVTGACLFIRRDFFRRIGGFEERYGMYFEDTDLCFKARRGGKRVFYEPASVVIHHEGKSSASRAVINDLNTRAARLFFKIWKTELYSIELETLIDREEGKYAYLQDHFWPDEVSPEEIVRMHNLLSSFPSCHVHFGGSGDALLLLSAFYDSDPEQTIVSVSNSTGMMRSFFDAFPKLKKVYFIPFPKNYTWHYIARRFFKSSDICRGLGATPTTTADYKEWNADLDIFKTYGIRQRPAWAMNFGKNRLAPRQVTLQPRGSLKGMVGSKRNALSTEDWRRLLSHLEKKGVRPVIIGTPDEAAEYPCFGNAIDMRSYSFAEQMKLIAASDFFIGADSWGKTFSALAGIPTFVFHALRGDDLKDWKDASDHVFLDPWDEITVVKDFKEFRKSFDEAWRERFLSAADLKIRWEGSQFVHHSLALVNRELCLRLIDAGCEVSIVPYERDQFTPKDEPRFKPIAERTRKPLSGPADVHVRHQWPPNFTPPPEGHWVIIQPWEFGSIPGEWVHNMSAHVDEVWVPSHYVRDCYIKSGVPSERVFVVPNGVDIGLFNPDNAPYPLKTKKTFKFLFVGGTIQRKGIDILLDVYTKTFSSGDDVCLVIKDMGGQTFYKGQTAKDWIDRFQADPGSPEIEYIEHTLSDLEIAGLYTACDCLAHPYRGEGFGLPIAEAMASGLPVIVTGHGAALDFCDDKTSYLIPAKEMRLPEKRIGEFDTVDFPWLAEPDKEGLARLMRHAETHREEAAAKGALAAEFIRANFTWDHAAEAVRKRVRELRGNPIVRQKRQDDSTSRKEGIQQELLSIIIPVSGEASNLRSCVDSIRKWTPEPHEMVFVESQAASGVKKWLKKISQRDPLCRVVPADGQPPVSDPVRLGLRSCTGKYVAVVEPDIVVTENWSAGMLEALERSADIGIVGPMMVNTEGRQNVPGTEGLSTSNLESHAAAFQKRNRHRRASSDRLSRSCMIFKRILADDIGLTNEGPQREECGPDEWCLRSIYSGFQNLIAGDVLVYRSGNGDGQRISCGAAGERKLSAFAAKGGCLNADTPEDKRFLAMLTFREAEERFQQGELRGATEACLEAIKLAPWKRGFYLALAEMLMQAKHFREALDLLRESDPGEQEERTVSLLGCIHEGLGEDDEAGRKADRALAMSSQSVQALNLKGVLAFKRGEIEQARSFFKKATDADPSWGEPFTNLGVLTWAEGHHAEALEFLERGFVLTPCQSDLADRYHAAAVSLGALARAEAVFREARGLYPSNRTIAFLRIDLLMAQENYPSAMAEIESAMAAFDVDEGFIAAALEVRGKIGPLEIRKKGGGETLSLCMIVKNEQSNLVRSLSSVRAVVDEIIVVDTGSTDRTKDIASVFGAKVFDAPWTDDFAEARNTALSKATGNWILVLDADEAVSPADCLKLKGLLKRAASRKDPAGWLVTTRNYSPDMNLEGWTPNDGSYGSEEAASGWFPSVKVRLFRNDPRIRYEGAVHEMVEPSMGREGLAWRSCDVIVHHYGIVTGGDGPSKGESYYQLGKKKIEQTGGDARSVYELAVQASRLKKYGEAVALWHRYLSSGCGENRHLAFLNLGHALIETGRYAEAREASMAALSIDPGLKEAGLNIALCEFYTGRYREAVSRLEGLVAATSDYPPAFVLLSAARLLSGEQGSAEQMVQTLRKRNINGAPFYQVYGQKLHEAGRNEDAETILEAAQKSWSAMLTSLGIPTTAENIRALMEAVPLDSAGKKEAPPETAIHATRSGSGRPCLSLCMIVKNEERSIARALESVKTLADEMIVVDTGSTDGTKAIAAALGAKVFDFPWTDDFSGARNYSLTRATGDWILVIDADETVSSRDHERLRDLILKSPAATGGYDLTTRNYVVEATTAGWVANDGSYRDVEAGTGWYPNRKVRLFRNDPRIRFSGAVHELVEQSMLKAGLTIGACDVPVHHTGKLDRESVLEKGERYYRLGLKKIEESGGTPRAILELATQAGELGRYDDAIRLWRRFLDGKPAQDVKQATINLIHACLNADRFDEALLEARKVAGQANGTRELLLNCAAAEFFTGDLRKATRMAEKILKKEPDYPPALTLLAAAHALAGHAGKSTECLQRLHEKGLQLRSQILPVIEKLRKAGKKDEAARLMSLLDRQPQAACGPTPPSPDRSRQGSGCSVQR